MKSQQRLLLHFVSSTVLSSSHRLLQLDIIVFNFPLHCFSSSLIFSLSPLALIHLDRIKREEEP
ncbi:hypothetical protein Syun_019144 [Stephania yunnanensis]|uniref:Uncharacterized protein n=1 Tax=Stephania yunnanensis TaxID=152371 RepID=A0AAP0ITJ5_9MAGN